MDLQEYKNIIDLNKMCGLCLTEDELLQDLKTVDIIVDNKMTSVLELLTRFVYLPIKIDERPLKICSDCCDAATALYKFKLQCESSMSLIEEYLSNNYDEEQIILVPIIDVEVDSNQHNLEATSADFDFEIHREDLDLSNVIKLEESTNNSHRAKEKDSLDYVDVNSDRFICEICGNKFKTKYNLRHHILRHQAADLFLCSICGKGFNVKGCLARHLNIHSLKKEYTCDECGRQFATSNNFRMHKRIHSGLRPYLCMLCGTAFRQPTSLTYHMRTHTQKRPYTCETCNKQFTLYGHYSTHKLLHTGERPFNCTVCGKGFVKKYDMNRHFSLVHSEKRDFLCTICGKQFACETYHRHHMMKHTKEWSHVCFICNKGFSRGSNLQRHSKICTVEKFEDKVRFKKRKELELCIKEKLLTKQDVIPRNKNECRTIKNVKHKAIKTITITSS